MKSIRMQTKTDQGGSSRIKEAISQKKKKHSHDRFVVIIMRQISLQKPGFLEFKGIHQNRAQH